MSAPHVVVVGGGLAGLQAGLACADAGARVSLFEASCAAAPPTADSSNGWA
jgi:NADPH-dependent 2,4-dienoyl-CoA reductase/sulfur reductase-like enzyme